MRFNLASLSLRATCFAFGAFMLASGGARAQSGPGATLNVPLSGRQTNSWNASSLMVQDGIEYVFVYDPLPPPSGTRRQVTYDYWVGGPSYDHITLADYYDIVDTQPAPIRTFPPNHTPLPYLTPIPKAGKLPLGPRLVPQDLTVKPETAQVTTRAFAKLRLTPLTFFRSLGLASSEELANAQLGTPLREYNVPAEELAKFTATSAPSSLLTGGQTLFYPILVNGESRSSMRVLAQPGAQARVIALGDTATAALLAKIPRVSALVSERSHVSIPAVRVPALGLYFVGEVSDGTLQIASIFDVPNLGLKAGRFEDAAIVFTRLAPFAAKLTGTM